MDRTDASPAGPPQSQSKLPRVLLWIVIAAALFRVVTAVMDHGKNDAGPGRVAWQPLEKAASIARGGGKPILYDFTAAWCEPCHRLDADWSDSGIATKVNEAFVPARVVDREQEDGRNPPEIDELQRRYEITGFPTLAVVASDGRLVGKQEGYRGRDALVQFLDESRGK